MDLLRFTWMCKAGEKRMNTIVDGVAEAIEEETEGLGRSLATATNPQEDSASIVVDQLKS